MTSQDSLDQPDEKATHQRKVLDEFLLRLLEAVEDSATRDAHAEMSKARKAGHIVIGTVYDTKPEFSEQAAKDIVTQFVVRAKGRLINQLVALSKQEMPKEVFF